MTDIKTLTNNGYTLFNVNKNKTPFHNGFPIKDWNSLTHDELKQKLDINSKMFGMRMGVQGNGKRILSLDFDCCKKTKDGHYIRCKETEELFDFYCWASSGTFHGMFDSSTDGNRNVLIDYSNSPSLIELITEIDKNKVSYLGLEILFGGNQVIPPTKTKCKIAGKCMREREFNTNQPFYVIEGDDCDIVKFIKRQITNSFKKNIKKKKLVVVEKEKEKENKIVDVGEEKDTKILDLISVEYLDDFDSWKKIMWGMKREGFMKEIGRKYSMKSNAFDEGAFNNVWDKSPASISITQGTINYYARISNPVEYEKLTARKDISLDVLEKGALSIANAIKCDLKEVLVYCNKSWYSVDEKTNLWMVIEKPSYTVVSVIHSYIKESLSILFDELQNTEDQEERKKLTGEISRYTKFYKTCDNAGFLSNMFNHLTNLLRDDNFINKLDNNGGHLVYKNGILNMVSGKFVEGIKQSDFITKTIPFNYKKASKEEIDFVNDVMLKICNDDEEHRKYYLSCLGYALLGKPHMQKAVYYIIGQGGDNGKTLILDSLSEIMPCYAKKIERKTFEKNYPKAHKHLKNIHGTRIAYVEELEKGKKQNVELLKELGDGKTISNEVLYGTDEIINILCKLFILGNHTPSFDSDGGMVNRLRQLQFNNNFGRDNKEDKIINGIHYYVPDITLCDKLKNKYKHALLSLLIEGGRDFEKNGMPDIPEMFAKETKQTLNMNDGFETWFQDHCVAGIGVKCGKEELMEFSGYKLRELNDELKRLGYDYVKDLRIKGFHSKGGWRGFKINDEPPPSDDEEEE